MHLMIDPLALGILAGIALLFGLLKFFLFPSAPNPRLAFSRLKELQLPTWRSRIASLPKKLHWLALASFFLAFIDPHFLVEKNSFSAKKLSEKETPREGAALYLALDQSGSMAQEVVVDGKSASKINLLKSVTKEFIKENGSNLIGLVSFARVPLVLAPLTLDQEALLHSLEEIEVVQDPEKDGTAIGYAIYKTAHLIAATRHFAEDIASNEKPPYTIKGAAIIVVTDGFQDPSRLDKGNLMRTMELDDAAAYAKSQHIRLYVINIDPALGSEKYAPQKRNLQKLTASTEGQFYMLSNPGQLQEIYSNIGSLEKGKIFSEDKTHANQASPSASRFSLYPLLIAIGLACLLASLFLELIVLKTVP